MPDGKRVALARFRKYFVELGTTFSRRARSKIKFGQGLAKRSGSVIKIWRAWSNFRPCCANRARRDERLTSIQLKAHPTEFCPKKSCARIVHLQRVGTAEVHSDG